MGAYQSSLQKLFCSPELFQFITSEQNIAPNDPFWIELLCFPPSVTVLCEGKSLYTVTSALVEKILQTNPKSGNIFTLVEIFISRQVEILAHTQDESSNLTIQAHNSLFMIRCLLQHIIQTNPEREVLRILEYRIPDASKGEADKEIFSKFINSIINILLHIPVKEGTYMLHCEAIRTLLVLLSSRLSDLNCANKLEIYNIIFNHKNAEALCKVLLEMFITQEKLPRETKLMQQHSGSIILDIAADIIGYFMPQPDDITSPLARSAVFLLLVLANNYTESTVYSNCLANSLERIDELYSTICNALDKKETTLILYHLLNKNTSFVEFMVNKADLEALLIPMLKTIYNASDSSCHMYMSLTILLLLTEDWEFNKKVHTMTTKNVSWYTERNLSTISLGGLIILVTTRTVQYNLKMRDEYLHTNCLAALANMSSQFTNLHPYVCQRLVSLFEILAKTYNRAKRELVAIERALRIILEVLNSCLTNQLVSNHNLIYTLLYKKKIFEPFKDSPAFSDIINNLDQVLEYFSKKLESLNESPDVEDVLAVIIDASSKWPSHRLQKFPELKFKYKEEEKPEDFFVPYVWSLVDQSGNIYLEQSCSKELQNSFA